MPFDPDSGSVVYFCNGEDTTSVLNGFTITGGSGTNYPELDFIVAGGINVEYCGAKIINNRIVDNHMQGSSGIYVHGAAMDIYPIEGAHVIVRNNLIQNNTVNGWWGGSTICTGGYGDIHIEGNRITNNSNTMSNLCGGALVICGGNPDYPYKKTEVIGNIIRGNSAQSQSGPWKAYASGIYVENSSPYIANNIIAYNHGGSGGGVWLGTWGGLVHDTRPVLVNNTIVNNISNYGGGVYVTQEGDSAHPVFINNIIWDNISQEQADSGQIYISDARITMRYCNVQGGYKGEGNIDVDPLFADSLFTLSDSSRCIGAGIHSIQIGEDWYTCPERCFSGHPRPSPQGTRPDLGAQEHVLGAPTAIPKVREQQPETFTLHQNYPNPFNPVTTIRYTVPACAETHHHASLRHIELTITNVLGEQITTLFSGVRPAGTYTVQWNAAGLPSGVYFCRLSNGRGPVTTRKLVLLR
jgi:hypothetical protein